MSDDILHSGQEPDQGEAPKEKRPGFLRKLLFGSVLRSVFSVLFLFTLSLILFALLSSSPKKREAGGQSSAKQSEKDLSETNRILSEENKQLKARVAKADSQGSGAFAPGTAPGLDKEIPFPPPPPGGQGGQVPAFSGPAPAGSCPATPSHGPVPGTIPGAGTRFNSPGDAITQAGVVQQGMGFPNVYKPLTVGVPASAAPHPPYSGQPNALGPSAEQKPEQKKEKNLLAGSRAVGSISHGIAAVPGLPYPVTIDLTSMTVGPNNTSRPLKDCSVIAVASADLSTSRILLQPKTLNCYLGGEYLSLDVDGYVIDLTDNLTGLHGKVEGRSGKYLWGIIAGSFAGGLGKAFAAAETTSTVSELGTSTTTVTGDKLKYGLTSGGAASADELARWFKERANKLVDYVQVPPLHAVKVIFTTSMHVPDGTRGINLKEMSWVR
ncbi:MAG: hypothetical protein K8I29_19250 [Alphaproteobacteria bacterium]|uniref:Uncharacterized protein n=1 Tax=Candidatus Nitrobium versatile TaxID=2884831 RepID=A0A953SIA6_9BACT|nr:hypothetical protein [Candidatus Nitrobium versatile]